MNKQHGETQDEVTVAGFEVPRSPDASYNNVYDWNEDEQKLPPMAPPHLQHTLLNYPMSRDSCGSLLLPHPVNLNHLYLDNKEIPVNHLYFDNREIPPQSVVPLGITHRFREKYVTVVLFKPVQRRGSTRA